MSETLYLEENLQLDYNHLESVNCICGTGKKRIGELLCESCMAALEPEERSRLNGMKPGEGVASACSTAHNRMWRAKRGWRV